MREIEERERERERLHARTKSLNSQRAVNILGGSKVSHSQRRQVCRSFRRLRRHGGPWRNTAQGGGSSERGWQRTRRWWRECDRRRWRRLWWERPSSPPSARGKISGSASIPLLILPFNSVRHLLSSKSTFFLLYLSLYIHLSLYLSFYTPLSLNLSLSLSIYIFLYLYLPLYLFLCL